MQARATQSDAPAQIFACLLLALAGFGYGTEQFPEQIIWKGEKHSISAEPLEEFFGEEHPRPNWLNSTSSACWRGYIASWEIRGDQLYLLKVYRDTEETDILPKIFPGRSAPLLADWYSDVIVIGMGGIQSYPTLACDSCYEQAAYLVFRKGVLVREEVVNNSSYGKTRSVEDLYWVFKGPMDYEDSTDWVDARHVYAMMPQPPYNTRGLMRDYNPEAGEAELSVWATPSTTRTRLRLAGLPRNFEPEEWSRVEVTITDWTVKTGRFIVENITHLEPGQTIHHPSFKAQGDGPGTD